MKIVAESAVKNDKGQRGGAAEQHSKATNDQNKDDQTKPDSTAPYLSAHNVYYVKLCPPSI